MNSKIDVLQQHTTTTYNNNNNNLQQPTTRMSVIVPSNTLPFVSGQYNPHSMISLQEPRYCRFLNVTIPADWMKYVIGSKGYYFKVITYQSGCSYIWFHKNENKIELWANNMNSLYDAEKRLLERMANICVEVLTNRGMMKDGKPVMKKMMWADVEEE